MEDENKNTNFELRKLAKKTPLVVSVVFFIGFSLLLFQNISLKQKFQTLTTELTSIDTELSQKKEELELCNSNKAKVVREYEEPYSQSTFKISSPLFEGKEVLIKDLLYRGSEIKQMDINIPADDEFPHPITVTVFDYVDVPVRNVKQFDEYQNATSILRIDTEDRLTLYTTKKGYKMARACGELGYSKTITSIHNVNIVISGYQCTGVYLETAEQQIRESTEYLEKIADVITF